MSIEISASRAASERAPQVASGTIGRTKTLLRMTVATSVLFGLLSSVAMSATPRTTMKASAAPSAASATKPEMVKALQAWRASLLRLPLPKTGCSRSSFPRVAWILVPCVKPPPYPMPPSRGHAKHFVVGGGGSNDFAATPSGTISSADGSFVSLSAGISETGQVNGSGPQVSNAYTLQLNTNFMTSTACAGSPNVNCKGWEQFVYVNDNTNHAAFIQYWLIKYNTTCPGGWNQYSFPPPSTDIYCYRNSPGAVSVGAAQPVGSLGNVILTGVVSAGNDGVTVSVSGTAYSTPGSNAVHASAGWTDAEFNVFGDGSGGAANFPANASVNVKTTIHNGTTNAPGCTAESFTGETNNLTLVGTPSIPVQTAPAIEFVQTSPGTPAACATAAGVGDTHLTTFGGLLYDFQAYGDFVLAQAGNDFVVQARQVSGAPNWPNAAINKAVATQMGQTRVAVCTAPSRLMVNGSAASIADGQTLSLPSGVDILRSGNAYIVIDQNGNSVRAEDDGTYINVAVGLGRWPASVSGILANANGNANQIKARTGTVLTAPFAFATLYHEYADSWRVQAKENVLSPCGSRIAAGIPAKPFYATDLKPEVYKRARATCTANGIKLKALLDACTLDVAVIGRETAAKVFVRLRAVRSVGSIVTTRANR